MTKVLSSNDYDGYWQVSSRIPPPVKHTLSYSALHAKTPPKETHATSSGDVATGGKHLYNVPR